MKHFLVGALFLTFFPILAQESEPLSNDYVKADSIAWHQVTVIFRENGSQYQRVKFTDSKGETIILRPEEATAYFASPDKLFYSKNIQIRDTSFAVFAEVLALGEQNLLKYKGDETYYLLEDSLSQKIQILAEENYQEILAQKYGEGDEQKIRVIEGLRFSDWSLTRFMEKVEEGKIARVPVARLDFEAGLAVTSFNPTTALVTNFPAVTDIGYGFGLSAVFPTSNSTSITTGLFFSKYDLTGSIPEQDSSHYRLRASQLQLPIMLRYTVQDAKVRPYFSAGFRFSQMLEESHTRYVQVTTDSTAQRNLVSAGFFDRSLWHVGTAVGVEFEINPQKLIYLEARYFYHLFRDEVEHIRNDFNFVVGFSL